eukprot:UN10531
MPSRQQSVSNSNNDAMDTAAPRPDDTNSESEGSSCSDYFAYKIKKLSRSLSKSANSLKSLSKSLSKLSKKKETPSSLKMTIQMGSAYLRRVDFSTIEPASMKRDDSAYFEELFSPSPTYTDSQQQTLPIPIKTSTEAGETSTKIKKKTVYSKSAS